MTNILNCPQVTITVWGDFALFSRPEGKVERITYPVPTPSAVRGMLASIYSKPAEFYWQVQRIEVLKKIQKQNAPHSGGKPHESLPSD